MAGRGPAKAVQQPGQPLQEHRHRHSQRIMSLVRHQQGHQPAVAPGAVIGDAAVPADDPLAEQAVLTDAAVDRLAQQVGMTGMAGRLLDQMQEDPPQGEVFSADGLHRQLLKP
jgi:hypothetical protein